MKLGYGCILGVTSAVLGAGRACPRVPAGYPRAVRATTNLSARRCPRGHAGRNFFFCARAGMRITRLKTPQKPKIPNLKPQNRRKLRWKTTKTALNSFWTWNAINIHMFCYICDFFLNSAPKAGRGKSVGRPRKSVAGRLLWNLRPAARPQFWPLLNTTCRGYERCQYFKINPTKNIRRIWLGLKWVNWSSRRVWWRSVRFMGVLRGTLAFAFYVR